jgi:glucose/arabinose dehydrogenase
MKMNKTIATLIVIVVGIGILAFAIKRKVGDIRPALLPPKENLAEIIEKQNAGDPVPFPLKLADGLAISVFAKDLDKPRDLEFSPRGTLLVSVPADGKIFALPDRNGDGKADEVKAILTGLRRPHGLAFQNGKLFVAEETRVVRYRWDEENLIVTQEKVLFALPRGDRHFTRTIAFDKQGRMFISIGSSCDVCFEKHEFLASVIVSDADGNNPRLWARGLRNAVFITTHPKTSDLWGTEMGRDWLGDNLPPDEVNIIRDGKDYGWPLCYGNRVQDIRFRSGANPCGDTESPVYEIGAHSAPLGLAFIASPQFPDDWQDDLLVALHGSWNRSIPVGYKIIRLRARGDIIEGEEDFLTGFLQGAEALGRPVDLAFSAQGTLFISDDKSGMIYRIDKQ